MKEQEWISGNRAAWSSMLRECCKELGSTDLEADKARWLVEREEVIKTLRRACDEFGDNDWDETLDLSDVIEKHLTRHLYRWQNGE